MNKLQEISLKGELRVPGDKSISHRALIFSALAKGKCRVSGLSPAEDCMSSARCLGALGLSILPDGVPDAGTGKAGEAGGSFTIESPGLSGLRAPDAVLDAGNSGTTIRLMSGLVAGRPFMSRFDGDASLRRRPMSRVLDLLCEMGAQVEYLPVEGERPAERGLAPFAISGREPLAGKHFKLKVASAQVQTALMLAGLQADGETVVEVPSVLRDHTQRMFRFLSLPFAEPSAHSVSVTRLQRPLEPFEIDVPADISSAAFFLVGAALLPGSDLLLTHLGMNVGRRLLVDVLVRMGAGITVLNEREAGGEPVADLRIVYSGRLTGTTISGAEIAAGIDEIPILALAGALADGQFVVEGAEELRHKESDRLAAITSNLKAAGASISDTADGFVIDGRQGLAGGSTWQTHEDHRLAMTGLIANLVSEKGISVSERESVKISYPAFERDLNRLTG